MYIQVMNKYGKPTSLVEFEGKDWMIKEEHKGLWELGYRRESGYMETIAYLIGKKRAEQYLCSMARFYGAGEKLYEVITESQYEDSDARMHYRNIVAILDYAKEKWSLPEHMKPFDEPEPFDEKWSPWHANPDESVVVRAVRFLSSILVYHKMWGDEDDPDLEKTFRHIEDERLGGMKKYKDFARCVKQWESCDEE